MTEIALAYSSIDKARAEAIGKVLGALGYTLSPQPLTAASVDSAAALVVFWSSGSVNSIPINQLASQASCDKKLVCVRAGHADPPAAYALVALHDLSRWTGSLDAPELRTFLQHVLRMAPPAGGAAQQGVITPQGLQQPAMARAPMSVAASNAPQPFAFAGPLGAATRPGEAPPRAFAPPLQATPPQGAPQPVRSIGLRAEAPPPREDPAPRRRRHRGAPNAKSARRTAPPSAAPLSAAGPAGGGAARVAFGAIAVSVIAGAAVAAFHYEPNQQNTAAASPDADATGSLAAVTVAPNALTEPSAAVASDAQPNPSTAGVQVASAEPLPAPLAAPETPATLQSNRGWTASLPTGPAVGARTANTATTTTHAAPVATPVSATTAPTPQRRVALRPAPTTALTPVDARPAPKPTDLVAVDNANLGSDTPTNTLSQRPRTPEEERAWIRKQAEYGPAQ